MAWPERRTAVPPEPVVDLSLDVGHGRLSMICEPPWRDMHRRIWESAVPVISIDDAPHSALMWGTSEFELPVGTHQLRTDVRPGRVPLDYKSIDRVVEIRIATPMPPVGSSHVRRPH